MKEETIKSVLSLTDVTLKMCTRLRQAKLESKQEAVERKRLFHFSRPRGCPAATVKIAPTFLPMQISEGAPVLPRRQSTDASLLTSVPGQKTLKTVLIGCTRSHNKHYVTKRQPPPRKTLGEHLATVANSGAILDDVFWLIVLTQKTEKYLKMFLKSCISHYCVLFVRYFFF